VNQKINKLATGALNVKMLQNFEQSENLEKLYHVGLKWFMPCSEMMSSLGSVKKLT